jgi:hypothetical protein
VGVGLQLLLLRVLEQAYLRLDVHIRMYLLIYRGHLLEESDVVLLLQVLLREPKRITKEASIQVRYWGLLTKRFKALFGESLFGSQLQLFGHEYVRQNQRFEL